MNQIGVKARENAEGFDGFRGAAIAEKLAQILQAFDIEYLHHGD